MNIAHIFLLIHPINFIGESLYYTFIKASTGINHSVKKMIYTIDNAINAIRFIMGFVLIILSFRAFYRTRILAMFYLTLGFSLITIGNLFSAIYFNNDLRMDNLISDIFDILGFIALIIAVKKS